MNIVDYLSDLILMDRRELLKFSSTSPYRYKVYEIPKRNSNGKRTIAQPSKELKYIQRALLKFFDGVIPIHDSVFSYKKGISIKDNACCHVNYKYLLKMDFKDFFPSITPSILFNEFEKYKLYFNDDDKKLLSGLLFWKKNRKNDFLQLSIGAPTSPFISNFILYSFDKAISDICSEKNVVYSRYADDITFSSNIKNVLFEFPKIVIELLYQLYNGNIKINKDKTVFSSRAHNRHVTGITLSNDGFLSIGREKKRKLSSCFHYYITRKLSKIEIDKLKGELAFAFYIEPDFKNRLMGKYGEKTLELLMRE